MVAYHKMTNFATKIKDDMKRLPIILIALAIGFCASITAQHKQSTKVKKVKVSKTDSTKTDTAVLKIRIPPHDSIPVGNAKDAA